jgi:hypothetical protein
MKQEKRECFERPAHKIQTPENHAEKEYNIHNTAEAVNQEHWTIYIISTYGNTSSRPLPFFRERKEFKKQDEKLYPIQEHTKLNKMSY